MLYDALHQHISCVHTQSLDLSQTQEAALGGILAMPAASSLTRVTSTCRIRSLGE